MLIQTSEREFGLLTRVIIRHVVVIIIRSHAQRLSAAVRKLAIPSILHERIN